MLDTLARSVAMTMARFGGPAKLVVDTGNDSYDPASSMTVSSITEYDVTVVAEDYIQKAAGLISENLGLIQTGDKRIFIQPVVGMPTPRVGVDSLLFQGAKWNIHTLKEYNPSGTKAYLYEVYARQ